MKEITIDFSYCRYIGYLHKEIKEKLDLPDWYGENLDALWDSLTGIIETPVKIKIIFKPTNRATREMIPFVKEIIEVFKEAETEYNEIKLEIDTDI